MLPVFALAACWATDASKHVVLTLIPGSHFPKLAFVGGSRVEGTYWFIRKIWALGQALVKVFHAFES